MRTQYKCERYEKSFLLTCVLINHKKESSEKQRHNFVKRKMSTITLETQDETTKALWSEIASLRSELRHAIHSSHNFEERKSNTLETHESKDEITEALRSEIASLQSELQRAIHNSQTAYFSSTDAMMPLDHHEGIPEHGKSARHVKERIDALEHLDFKPQLNTSSYVNVCFEPEEMEVAQLGLTTNIADASVYPASVRMHNTVVNMLAKLWNAPEPADKNEDYSGSGTVGSTEACLLAGLALKFRWRKWYAKKFNKTQEEVQSIRPNIVISTAYQAAWEKFFRYFDVDCKLVRPKLANQMRVEAKELVDQCDEKTIAIVAILGNHYNGAYDPVWEIDEFLKKFNEEKGYQIGIHVDAASGGFIAPFEDGMPAWDFRLDSVLTISTSGHKFGESICGTGWVIFRQREDLSEHIAVSVTYLGGHSDSITLNFSRPASGIYVQYYKFLRLGMQGYRAKVNNQMKVAEYLRSVLREMKDPDTGKPDFLIVDSGDTHCLPVVAARLNPEITRNRYNDIDLQHALYESHWYVSGYSLAFENFAKGGMFEPLCTDAGEFATMFRIVVKKNLTLAMAQYLAIKIKEAMPLLKKTGQSESVKEHIRKLKAFSKTVGKFMTFTHENEDEIEEIEEMHNSIIFTGNVTC